MVQIDPVVTTRQQKEFVRCAAQFYRELPAWVPPFEPDLRRLLDPRRSDFFRVPGNDAAFFLARRDGRVVGRIAAIRNAVHLEANHDGAGFFGFFECEDNPDTARALLRQAEVWLAERGLRSSRGPANFNVQEEAGVLLDGFELQPMLGMTYTPAYYRTLLEAAGYAPCRDLLVYRVVPAAARMDQFDRIAAAAERSHTGMHVRPLNMAALDREAVILERVFADAWRNNWGVVPISAEEFWTLYRRYQLFLIPELIFIAEIDGEPAGAIITMPDLNVIIKQAGGRLWPFGWWKLLRGRRHITRYRTMMMGVRPQFQRTGLPLVFLQRTKCELLRRGASLVEFSWILEDNHSTRSIIERIGGQRVQTLRLYEKALA